MKVRGINGKFTRGTKRSREEQAAYMRAYRAAHPDKWAREASPACMLADQIRTHCVFCAETELCCLVFHHLDPKTKNKKLTRGRQMSNLPGRIHRGNREVHCRLPQLSCEDSRRHLIDD